MNNQLRPASDESTWDAVVIGSGLGGLTTAAYLAASGKKVLVLEQFTVAGGNSHVFRRQRSYEFDVGVHYLGDCGEDGVIPAILNGVGLAGRTEFLPMDQDGFDQVRLPGIAVDMPQGWDRYGERLKAALPDETDGIATYIDVCSSLAAEQRFALLAGAEVAPMDLATRSTTTRQWGRRTLEELFVHCGLSTRARMVLAAQAPNYGLTPKQATVARHAAVFDHYARGAYYPAGGGQMLAGGLVESIEAHGGQVRTKARAQRILVENGKVTGVGLESGELLHTPLVVSNADYRRTVLDLVGAEHFRPKLASRTQGAVMGMPWLVVYLGLDMDMSDRPNANLWWFDGDDDLDGHFDRVNNGNVDEVQFLFASFASRKDPENRALCPPGHSNLQLMTLSPPDYTWWGIDEGPASGAPYRRNSEYQRKKDLFVEATLTAAEKAIGPFRDRISFIEAATPLTHERYILSTGGTPCGLAEWGGAHWPDTETTIEGLHMVGANTKYGSGIGGVMVSGIMCAGNILGQRLLSDAHRGAVLGDPTLLPERGEGWDPREVCRGSARRRSARRRVPALVD